MIRVFIVADSMDRTEAMAALLEEDGRFEMGEIDFADVILCIGVSPRRIPKRGTPVVCVSADPDSDAPFDDTLKAWLPSNSGLEAIAATLEAAARGLTVLTRQQSRRTFRNSRQVDETALELGMLTAREQEVLQMIAAGMGNKQIGGQLGISTNTAKFHVAQILSKLAAGSRAEAVSIAIRRGLVLI